MECVVLVIAHALCLFESQNPNWNEFKYVWDCVGQVLMPLEEVCLEILVTTPCVVSWSRGYEPIRNGWDGR